MDYDPNKRESNLKKHGFDFEDADRVFDSDEVLTTKDINSQNELRHVTYGPLYDQLVIIITADNGDHVRVISMRKATKREKEYYYANR